VPYRRREVFPRLVFVSIEAHALVHALAALFAEADNVPGHLEADDIPSLRQQLAVDLRATISP
jgi:hypothetical protein